MFPGNVCRYPPSHYNGGPIAMGSPNGKFGNFPSTMMPRYPAPPFAFPQMNGSSMQIPPNAFQLPKNGGKRFQTMMPNMPMPLPMAMMGAGGGQYLDQNVTELGRQHMEAKRTQMSSGYAISDYNNCFQGPACLCNKKTNDDCAKTKIKSKKEFSNSNKRHKKSKKHKPKLSLSSSVNINNLESFNKDNLFTEQLHEEFGYNYDRVANNNALQSQNELESSDESSSGSDSSSSSSSPYRQKKKEKTRNSSNSSTSAYTNGDSDTDSDNTSYFDKIADKYALKIEEKLGISDLKATVNKLTKESKPDAHEKSSDAMVDNILKRLKRLEDARDNYVFNGSKKDIINAEMNVVDDLVDIASKHKPRYFIGAAINKREPKTGTNKKNGIKSVLSKLKITSKKKPVR